MNRRNEPSKKRDDRISRAARTHKAMGWTRDGVTAYYAEHGWVALLFAPDGSHIPVRLLHDGMFHGAGLICTTVEAIADRVDAHWDEGCLNNSTYERQERAFTERGDRE